MKKYFRVLLSAFFMMTAINAVSATISFQPENSVIAIGNSTDVDIVISDLGNQIAPSLGAFDFNLNYDSSIVSFANIVFGTGLDIFGFGTSNGIVNNVNSLNIYEVSYDWDTDLIDYQLDTFVLATVTFSAVSSGISALDLVVNDFADEAGNSMQVFSNSGSITVKTVSVPETPVLLLFLTGLLGVFRLKK